MRSSGTGSILSNVSLALWCQSKYRDASCRTENSGTPARTSREMSAPPAPVDVTCDAPSGASSAAISPTRRSAEGPAFHANPIGASLPRSASVAALEEIGVRIRERGRRDLRDPLVVLERTGVRRPVGVRPHGTDEHAVRPELRGARGAGAADRNRLAVAGAVDRPPHPLVEEHDSSPDRRLVLRGELVERSDLHNLSFEAGRGCRHAAAQRCQGELVRVWRRDLTGLDAALPERHADLLGADARETQRFEGLQAPADGGALSRRTGKARSGVVDQASNPLGGAAPGKSVLPQRLRGLADFGGERGSRVRRPAGRSRSGRAGEDQGENGRPSQENLLDRGEARSYQVAQPSQRSEGPL